MGRKRIGDDRADEAQKAQASTRAVGAGARAELRRSVTELNEQLKVYDGPSPSPSAGEAVWGYLNSQRGRKAYERLGLNQA